MVSIYLSRENLLGMHTVSPWMCLSSFEMVFPQPLWLNRGKTLTMHGLCHLCFEVIRLGRNHSVSCHDHKIVIIKISKVKFLFKRSWLWSRVSFSSVLYLDLNQNHASVVSAHRRGKSQKHVSTVTSPRWSKIHSCVWWVQCRLQIRCVRTLLLPLKNIWNVRAVFCVKRKTKLMWCNNITFDKVTPGMFVFVHRTQAP